MSRENVEPRAPRLRRAERSLEASEELFHWVSEPRRQAVSTKLLRRPTPRPVGCTAARQGENCEEIATDRRCTCMLA
jgi:hypothetical protein